jgi:SPP1 gp7 family putative phage head morphogenesis protein
MSPSLLLTRRQQYGAFHEALDSLYSADRLTLAQDNMPDTANLQSLFDALADLIYKDGRFTVSQLRSKEARRVIAETANVLAEGVNTQLPTDVPDTLRYALEENTFTFSGFKTFHAMREIGLSLVAEDGNIKPFSQFKEDVKAVNDSYNVNYLRAEYQQAVGASQMAAKWVDIERDGDRYDLQYRTAQDNRVREDHALLHGTTLPPSDPFWDKYYPPNGWGCRCTVVQVRHGKYPLSDPELAMKRGDNSTAGVKQQMFRFNPGKQMKLFPPKHPYYKTPASDGKTVSKVASDEFVKRQRKELAAWYKSNMPTVKVGKFSAKRFDVNTSDGTVYVNKDFYRECAFKYADDSLYPVRLAYARKAHEMLAKATKLYDEPSKDHPDAVFEVWQYDDKEYRVEFKVKRNADGRFLHYMRLYKK